MQLQTPTLSLLLQDVRRMLGQPNPLNSTWSDDDIKHYLNEGIRMYFVEVIKNSEGYFMTSTNLNIVANQEAVALPTDFYEVRALYIQRTNGWEILTYSNDITNGFQTNSGTSGNTYSPFYYFLGNNIILHPTPNFSQTGVLRLDYVQFPDQMLNGGDPLTSQVSPIFKQLLTMYAVYKCKLQESLVNGVDLSGLAAQDLNNIYNSFKAAINKRSQYPEFVVPFNPECY